MALPGNKIPRVFSNTGIEYNDITKYVKEIASQDNRFQIISPGIDIRKTLDEKGYPFKSKMHSHNVNNYQKLKKECDEMIRQIENDPTLKTNIDFYDSMGKGKSVIKYVYGMRVLPTENSGGEEKYLHLSATLSLTSYDINSLLITKCRLGFLNCAVRR